MARSESRYEGERVCGEGCESSREIWIDPCAAVACDVAELSFSAASPILRCRVHHNAWCVAWRVAWRVAVHRPESCVRVRLCAAHVRGRE